jgi:tryptophan synthase alpha chain
VNIAQLTSFAQGLTIQIQNQNRLSRITSIFSASRPLLIPFLTGGYPSLEATRLALSALDRALGGRSIIEIGFPFTDPIADGPVIASSMHEALQKGVTPHAIFDLVKRLRSEIGSALVAMVTDSIITRIGPERFIADAAAAGFDGLIVPDVDLDAAVPLSGLAKLHNLSFTMLIAPTTTPPRAKRIVELCGGFVYLLARVGITGQGSELDQAALRERIEMLRGLTKLPIAVGFGISRAEDVRKAGEVADGVIVGSAIVKCMSAAPASAPSQAAAAETLVRELSRGLAVKR